MDTYAVEVAGLSKSFRDVVAVEDVSLTVPRGEIVALLGKNGAGKTTLIDLTLGLQKPDAGSSKILGYHPREAIRRSLVGVVNQTGALLEDASVGQAVSLVSALHPYSLDMRTVLAEAHLEHLAKRGIRKLSGGERQRVRLALALIPDPEILILDEPTAGMDAVARRDFWALMRTQAEHGRTIIFATHYLAEVEDFAQRTVIMKDGHIVADGSTDSLRARSALKTLSIRVARDQRENVRRQLTELSDITSSWDASDSERDALLTVHGAHLDDAARLLLNIPGAHDLEITPASMEETFAKFTD
ncbi:ABC transporter ATP-binding protein [Arcanobacterium haemolyticum]|nr:ABC transporter ATP-binding protein [Arcanobacterium haemolyticum]